MPKRRRLFTPNKYKLKSASKIEQQTEGDVREREVSSARGRFKGALLEALEPPHSEESGHSSDESPVKRERHQSSDAKQFFTDEEVKKAIHKSPPRQSYVLKLFDRSVDLSQFRDDSPLYPICRAWMTNQPKANYNGYWSEEEDLDRPGRLELPGPEGAPVDNKPALLPEQRAADKHRINLDYEEAPPPSREQLLRMHMPRWAAVKQAWQDQIALKEIRYEGTQRVLNSINLEYPAR